MDFFNVTSVIEGIATGAIAVLIYMGRKSVEAQSMKRDLATMMIMEIQYNKKIVYINQESGEQLSFSRESYAGLLSNANIRYFEIQIQLMLQNLDNKITKCIGSYDPNDFDDVMAILEKMKCKNTHTQFCKCMKRYCQISSYIGLIYYQFKTSSEYKARNCTAMSGLKRNDHGISSPI